MFKPVQTRFSHINIIFQNTPPHIITQQNINHMRHQSMKNHMFQNQKKSLSMRHQNMKSQNMKNPNMKNPKKRNLNMKSLNMRSQSMKPRKNQNHIKMITRGTDYMMEEFHQNLWLVLFLALISPRKLQMTQHTAIRS